MFLSILYLLNRACLLCYISADMNYVHQWEVCSGKADNAFTLEEKLEIDRLVFTSQHTAMLANANEDKEVKDSVRFFGFIFFFIHPKSCLPKRYE